MLYIPYPFKRCTKCGNEYPATLKYFRRKKENADGLHSWCRQCGRDDHHVYQRTHPENTDKWKRQYQQTHPEQYRKTKRRSYLKHREEVLRACKDYRHTKRGKQVARAGSATYRTKKIQQGGTYTADDIQAQYKRQKGRCYYAACGHTSLKNGYHIDHVIPVSRGGTSDPCNLVLACPSCNQRKNDRLPHEWPEGGRLL